MFRFRVSRSKKKFSTLNLLHSNRRSRCALWARSDWRPTTIESLTRLSFDLISSFFLSFLLHTFNVVELQRPIAIPIKTIVENRARSVSKPPSPRVQSQFRIFDIFNGREIPSLAADRTKSWSHPPRRKRLIHIPNLFEQFFSQLHRCSVEIENTLRYRKHSSTIHIKLFLYNSSKLIKQRSEKK